MVQIQSSWFPVIDRNPQKFVDIYRAQEADFQPATQRVYRSGSHPSYLKLNVVGGQGVPRLFRPSPPLGSYPPRDRPL